MENKTKDADKRREILAKLVEESSLTEVSKLLGKPDRQLNDMIAGRKSFGASVARDMERYAATNFNKLHLYYFDGLSMNENETIDLPPNSYMVDTSKLTSVPVYGKAMGGLPDRLFTDEGRLSNGHDEYGEVYSSDKTAFITRVEGNSMMPKYFHGGYALVEPSNEPEIEDDVLIKLTTGQVMLKKLVSRRGGVVLSSYNDPVIHTFTLEQIVWMYYVPNSVPARKIRQRV